MKKRLASAVCNKFKARATCTRTSFLLFQAQSSQATEVRWQVDISSSGHIDWHWYWRACRLTPSGVDVTWHVTRNARTRQWKRDKERFSAAWRSRLPGLVSGQLVTLALASFSLRQWMADKTRSSRRQQFGQLGLLLIGNWLVANIITKPNMIVSKSLETHLK